MGFRSSLLGYQMISQEWYTKAICMGGVKPCLLCGACVKVATVRSGAGAQVCWRQRLPSLSRSISVAFEGDLGDGSCWLLCIVCSFGRLIIA